MNATDHAATLPTRTGQYVRSSLALMAELDARRESTTPQPLPSQSKRRSIMDRLSGRG